jgi:hypothetical protein
VIENIQEEDEKMIPKKQNKMSKSTIYTEKQGGLFVAGPKMSHGVFLIVVVVSVSKSRFPRVRYDRTATGFILLAKQ